MSGRSRKKAQPAETSLLPPQGSGPLRVALAFPNTYYVGMSNLGYQAVFRLFAESPGVRCERVFLPDAGALESHRRTGSPLCSLETGSPLDAFHVVAFSLSFENDYLNILTMLRLGRVPVLQAGRDPRGPLVIGGGAAAMLNPEPLADFFDLFILGEAEEVLGKFCAAALEQLQSFRTCRDPAAYRLVPGVYIPSGYEVRYGEDGTPSSRQARPGFPERIESLRIGDLDRHPTASCFISPNTEFADMGLVEVSRGCSRRCRFCAVGSLYHPYRARGLGPLLQASEGPLGSAGRVGLLGAAVSDLPHLPDLIRAMRQRGSKVSVSSLRADALTEDMVGLLQECGHKTFTIAPEAGSERLRRVIGKRLALGQIEHAAAVLSRCHVPNIKLYFMVGLPTETDADIAAIPELIRHIRHIYYKEAQGEKWLRTIQVSISPFVPKPWTPFQWAAADDVQSLKRKLKAITGELRGERKVAVGCDLPKWGYVQALLSRGDRRVGRLLCKVFELNGDWNRAFRSSDLNPDFYIYRERGENEMFPWDFIDHGLDKKALWREWRRALEQ